LAASAWVCTLHPINDNDCDDDDDAERLASEHAAKKEAWLRRIPVRSAETADTAHTTARSRGRKDSLQSQCSDGDAESSATQKQLTSSSSSYQLDSKYSQSRMTRFHGNISQQSNTPSSNSLPSSESRTMLYDSPINKHRNSLDNDEHDGSPYPNLTTLEMMVS